MTAEAKFGPSTPKIKIATRSQHVYNIMRLVVLRVCACMCVLACVGFLLRIAAVVWLIAFVFNSGLYSGNNARGSRVHSGASSTREGGRSAAAVVGDRSTRGGIYHRSRSRSFSRSPAPTPRGSVLRVSPIAGPVTPASPAAKVGGIIHVHFWY